MAEKKPRPPRSWKVSLDKETGRVKTSIPDHAWHPVAAQSIALALLEITGVQVSELELAPAPRKRSRKGKR